MRELATICEEQPASLRLQGYISAFALCPTCVSCSRVWDCEESVAGGKGISEVPLEHLGAAYQMCRAAGLPSAGATAGR